MKRNVFVLTFVGLACVVAMSSLTGCLKNNDNSPNPSSAVISVYQASPGAPLLDLYLNTGKAGSKLPYDVGGQTSAPVGNYVISLVNSTTGDTLLQRQDSLQAADYSMIVYDTGSAMKLMFFQDQFAQTTNQGSVYLRFLQLSPDAGPVNFFIDSTSSAAARSFADNLVDPEKSMFKPVGQGTYTFTATNAITGDTLGHIPAISLVSQSGFIPIFTVFLRGLKSHTQDSLGLKLDIFQNY